MLGKKLGGRYQIVERLGAGGMGVVYRAHDSWLDRTVAIKVLRPELSADAEFLRRFRREAKAAASLSHPSIVSVFDVGEDDGFHYLVMEYVPGPTLGKRLDQQPLPVSEAIRVAMEVGVALEHAHSHDVVHRDIKPQNILLGVGGQVKVADFGIARAGAGSTVTHSHSIMGSVHYLAPEQIQGSAGDRQSDIYSLGVVLYQMITGQLPFQGETPISVAVKHVHEDPLPLRRLAPQVPLALERVVQKAMRKDPEQRYGTAAEMVADLQSLGRGAVEAAAVSKGEVGGGNPYARPRPSRRPRWVAWATLAVLLVAAMVYGGYALARWWYVPVLTTPNVLHQDISAAEEQLRTYGLQYSVAGQRYSPEVGVSQVLEQDPAPGEPVKKGGLVKLWLSLGPEYVTGGVPDIQGKTWREAQEILRSAGLEARASYRYDDAQPAEVVLSQKPRPGDPALKGSTVDVEVSKGPEPVPVAVPSVYGLTVEQATARLKEGGLEPGTVEDVPSALARGLVAGQSPLAEEEVPRGTAVNLLVSKGTDLAVHRSLVPVEVPGQAGENHLVRIELRDDLGSTVVFSARRPSGSFPLLITWAGKDAEAIITCDGQVVSHVKLKG